MNNEQFITQVIAKLKSLRAKTINENTIKLKGRNATHLVLPPHEISDRELLSRLKASGDTQLDNLKILISAYRDAIKEYQQVIHEKYSISSTRAGLLKNYVIYSEAQMKELEIIIEQSEMNGNNDLIEQFLKSRFLTDDHRKAVRVYVEQVKAAKIFNKEIESLNRDADQFEKNMQTLTKKAEYLTPIAGLLQDIDAAKILYDAAVQNINRITNENKRYEEIIRTRQLAKQLIQLIDRLQFAIARIDNLSPHNVQNSADTERVISQAKSYLTNIIYSNPQTLLENIPHANDPETQLRDKALAYLNDLKLQQNNLGLNENSEIHYVEHHQSRYSLKIHDGPRILYLSIDEAEFKKFARLQDASVQKENLDIVGEFEFDEYESNPISQSVKQFSGQSDGQSAIRSSQTTISMGDQTKKATAFANSYRTNAETIRSLLTDQRHVAHLNESNAENVLKKYNNYIEYIKTDYQGYMGAIEYIDQQAKNHLTTLYAAVFKKNNADKASEIDSVLNQIAKINRLAKPEGSIERFKRLQATLSTLKQDDKLPGMVDYIHLQEQKLAKESSRTSILQMATHRLIPHSNRNNL